MAVVGGLAVAGISVTVAVALWPDRGEALMTGGGDAEYVQAPQVASLVDGVGFPILAGAAVAALASLVVRFGRARDRERRQILWVLVAAALVLMVTILFEVVPAGRAQSPPRVSAWSWPRRSRSPSVLRSCATGSMTSTRSWTARSCGSGSLRVVVAVYVAVVGSLDAVLRDDGDAVVSLVVTAVIAIAFAPARDRLQRAVNRLVYGERDDPYRVLSRLGERLETALEPRAVLPVVVEAVSSALKVPYVAIEVVEDDGWRLAAQVGHATDVVRVPLVYGSETVGTLVIAPRAPGEQFGTADHRLLTDLARQIGVAVHAVRLTDDLQRSRERLVLAREEERRRLRRDLHDGLGPSLSSALLKIAAARRQLPETTPADAVLQEVRDDLRSMVGDIRTLAHGLRPPSLDQFGLVAALEEFGASSAEAMPNDEALSVTVTTPEALPPLPAAVEVAAYLIAREALTNAARHSGGRSVLVRLRVPEADRLLLLEILDDGHGIPNDHRVGVGLTSMKERAEELGGTLTVEASASGSRVLARIPLGTSRHA